MRFTLFFFSFMLCSSAAAKNDYFSIVSMHFGFGEAIEFCKWKHHGSAQLVEKEFLLWSERHKSLIETAYKKLEDEAKNDPKKAEKLQNLGSILTRPWFEFFTKLPDWQSSIMCFERAALLETFNIEKLNDI